MTHHDKALDSIAQKHATLDQLESQTIEICNRAYVTMDQRRQCGALLNQIETIRADLERFKTQVKTAQNR